MKWRDRETMVELYKERKLSTKEVGEKLGCSAKTVSDWLRKHGIEARTNSQAHQINHEYVPYETYSRGYERWYHRYSGDRSTIRVHRLLAVSEFGVEAVKDQDIHHKNGIYWDNRPENIEVLDHVEHAKIHNSSDGQEAEP
jgi:transcriptional regulator with XRE-family HTH domain